MSAQASGASGVERLIGVIGVPGLGVGGRSRPGQFDGLSVLMVEPAGQIGGAFRLEATGARVIDGGPGAALGGLQPPLADPERVPVQTQPAT